MACQPTAAVLARWCVGAYTHARWAWDACRSAHAYLLGEGVTAIHAVLPSGKLSPVYCIDTVLGTLRYLATGLPAGFGELPDGALLHVRYVRGGAFHECLMPRGSDILDLRALAAAAPSGPRCRGPLMVCLNGLDVTHAATRVLSSARGQGDTAVSVRDLATFLLAAGRLTHQECRGLALRQDPLRITVVASDLEESRFEEQEVIQF